MRVGQVNILLDQVNSGVLLEGSFCLLYYLSLLTSCVGKKIEMSLIAP